MKAASLTGSLLARKGAAQPSGLTFLAGVPSQGAAAAPRPAAAANTPSAVAAPQRAEKTCGPVAKLTLRLDRDRHLRLKLASVHARRSIQEILTLALDEYLERVVPEAFNGRCACLSAPAGAADLTYSGKTDTNREPDA